MEKKSEKTPQDIMVEISMKLIEQEEKQVDSVLRKFNFDSSPVELSYSSEGNPLAVPLFQAKAPPNDQQSPTQEQLSKRCFQIMDNVKHGKTDNAVIHMDKGLQIFERSTAPLGNTIIKLLPMGFDKETCLFLKSGSTVPAKVFIGGDNPWAILALKDDKDNVLFLRLREFHLLSVQEKTDPRKETGLMTSYSWLTGKMFSSYITAFNLYAVKNLLLSSWLEQEWQRAKEAQEHSTNKLEGGDANEQEKQKEGRHFEN